MASSDTRWLTGGEPACSIEIDADSTGSSTDVSSTEIEVDSGSTGSSTGFSTKIEVDAGSTGSSTGAFLS